MGIFLDTGFLVGLCHPNDDFHQNSVNILKEMSTGKFGLIYTSPYVISEAATLLLIRTYGNLKLIEEFYDLLYGTHQFTRILPWTSEIEKRTWELFKDINQKAKTEKDYISFVDASNIAYCRTYDIDHIASFDSHFDGFLIRIM